MTYYEENIHILAKYYPEMDIRIKEAQKDLKPNIEVIEETSYEGEPILKVKKEDKVYYLNGKRNTLEPAQMWVETLGELQRNNPVIMMGTGNPTYLQQLAENTENRISIIVYEPSIEIFLKFLEMMSLKEMMKKHLIVFWVDGLKDMEWKYLRGVLQSVLTYDMLSKFRHLILPNYEKIFEKEAVEFTRLCYDIALSEVTDYNTKKKFSNIMVQNLLENSKFLCDGYKTTQLPDVIPKDIPGIVVAAGPSLNKNMQELKKAKGKALIIAVDTAIKPLLQAGIIPDMFAVIDAMKPLKLVKLESAKKIPLVTTLNAAPEVLKYHTGMKFFFNEGYQFAERIFIKTKQKVGEVPSGGSVATNLFSLLYKIGITRIILVGQDLAYTDNKSHADGTFQDVMETVDTRYFKMVEGNYEEKVPTRLDFKLFIDWYNMFIEGCKEYDENFRVINATEGGAKIKNTEIMTLREAIEQECTQEVDIQACLKKLSPMLDAENRAWTVQYLYDFEKEFLKLQQNARKLKKLYQKLDVLCDRKHIEKKEYTNLLHKLKKQIRAVEIMGAYQLVMFTMENAQYILRGDQFLEKDSLQEEGKEIARKGIILMENVIKMASVCQEFSKEVFGEEFLEKYAGTQNENM